MAELGKLPGWVRSVLGEPNERWCGLCGLPEGHAAHDLSAWGGHADVAAGPLGVDEVARHELIAESAGPSDGRSPRRGEMRMPGWENMLSFLAVPLLEGYRQSRTLAAGGFVVLWREPRTSRWRWAAVSADGERVSDRSATWLHDALAGARSEFAEVFAPRGS